jgi:predicted secreted protein
MEKKDTAFLLTLIAVSLFLFLVPLKINYGWLFILHIIVYGLVGFLLTKAVNSTNITSAESNNSPGARLQIFIWTILISALISTVFIYNLHSGNCGDSALDVKIPTGYWILLGISGVVQAIQANFKPKAGQTEGLIYNYNMGDPTNPIELPVERLQFILFLTITASAFIVFAFQLLSANKEFCITELPKISETIAILSAVSNGVYLAPKILKY